MNWILLIIAGLFETGFATCLAKANTSTGNNKIWWMSGFLYMPGHQHVPAIPGYPEPTHRNGICSLDWNRCSRYRYYRNCFPERAGHFLEVVFYHNIDFLDYRVETDWC
jgi:hypothetical protein